MDEVVWTSWSWRGSSTAQGDGVDDSDESPSQQAPARTCRMYGRLDPLRRDAFAVVHPWWGSVPSETEERETVEELPKSSVERRGGFSSRLCRGKEEALADEAAP